MIPSLPRLILVQDDIRTELRPAVHAPIEPYSLFTRPTRPAAPEPCVFGTCPPSGCQSGTDTGCVGPAGEPDGPPLRWQCEWSDGRRWTLWRGTRYLGRVVRFSTPGGLGGWWSFTTSANDHGADEFERESSSLGHGARQLVAMVRSAGL